MMIRFSFIILFALITLSCGGLQVENQFEARQVRVGDNIYNYRVYNPKNRPADAKLPVMLYLHGSNARGDDNLAQVQGFNRFIAENPERFNFIIVAPQCRSGTFWAGPMIEQAIAAVDQTVKEFNGDENKLYLAGYSMGAYGVWHAGVLYPDKFAALVPAAGGIVPNGALSAEDRALVSPKIHALAEADDPYQAFAAELKNKPIWIFHGGRDNVVPVDGSRRMAAALKESGNAGVNYTELESAGHDIVAKPFSDPVFFEWLARQQKQ